MNGSQQWCLSKIILWTSLTPMPYPPRYNKGIRIIIHTANLIYADCNSKTQGIWWQDFPPKESEAVCSDFEEALLNYLSQLKMPKEAHERMKTMVSAHDFSGARVKLITSVPGEEQYVEKTSVLILV